MSCITHSKAEAQASEWTSQFEAAKRLGCSTSVVRKLGQAGHLSVRRLPRADPLYLVTELDRLARKYTRYASPEPEPAA